MLRKTLQVTTEIDGRKQNPFTLFRIFGIFGCYQLRAGKAQMTCWKASGIHLAICGVIASFVLALMILVWYPAPYFQALGGQKIAMIVIVVDVIVGPLLTLIVYRPMKKGLKFDLTVIALLQVGALAYGVSVLYQGRPVYVVFVKDRFDIVTAVDIDTDSLKKVTLDEFKSLFHRTGDQKAGSRKNVAMVETTVFQCFGVAFPHWLVVGTTGLDPRRK